MGRWLWSSSSLSLCWLDIEFVKCACETASRVSIYAGLD